MHLDFESIDYLLGKEYYEMFMKGSVRMLLMLTKFTHSLYLQLLPKMNNIWRPISRTKAIETVARRNGKGE